jgi:protoporphyrinogen/coproporphyrinogen III oxidase
VRAELNRSLGIDAAPELVHQAVWPLGIPQYRLGHAARLRSIDDALAKTSGVVLAGNAYRGLGVNDCVAAGQRAAAAVIEALRRAARLDLCHVGPTRAHRS